MLIELALKSCKLHHVRFDVEEIQFGIGSMLCIGERFLQLHCHVVL